MGIDQLLLVSHNTGRQFNPIQQDERPAGRPRFQLVFRSSNVTIFSCIAGVKLKSNLKIFLPQHLFCISDAKNENLMAGIFL